jgi:L-ascorbate metabolism protein UlaG (beta-lactamase superfamily)
MGEGVQELGVLQEADRLNVSWVGHSTVLVEAGGTRLLTDPLLRPRVTHLRRVAPAPAPLEGELDAVLISHLHYDHLDLPSLRRLRARQFVVPLGAGRPLSRRGLGPVVELEAGEELSIGTLNVRATHAEHDVRRVPLGATTPALGYIFEGPRQVYFAGDTGIFDGMRALAPVDVALLPIWGWGPRLGAGHMGPTEAAEALRLLEPRLAIPIHWGTYLRIGMPHDRATLREPAERFERLAAELAPEVSVRVLVPGERVSLEATGAAAP